jgi:hypothetical protein
VGQLLRLAKERGAAVPPSADSVFADLCKRAGGNLASLIGTISAASISANDLLDLAKMGGSARYSDDVGYDMQNAAIAACRALADEKYIEDAVETSFALELLADRGVAVPGWDEAAVPPPAPSRVHESAEFACSVSREGLSVVQAGFDANGRLVRVSAVAGHMHAPIREPDDLMHESRFKTWAADFPYRYGIDESTPNLFYTTTADLRLSALPEGAVVVASEPLLSRR